MEKSKKQSFSFIYFLLLVIVWLLLANSYSLGNIVLACCLAYLIPKLVSKLQLDTAPIKRPGLALYYVLILMWDIVVCNVTVARQVLGPIKKMKPGFISVPLSISGELPLTMLASTISLTPGTVSVDVSKDKTQLYIHALHIDNEQQMIDLIKTRYESRLKEIFEC